MKKNKPEGKKLLLSQEKVRDLNPATLAAAGGAGIYDTTAGQSYGGTYPAPTKDGAIQYNFYYYY